LRAGVQDLLREKGRSPAHIRAVTLVVSELATNALLYAAPPYLLSVEASDLETMVEVRDTDEGRVHLREPAQSDGGYGLQLIEVLASEWGSHVERGTKVVHATIARSSGL
jgi:two-component sensor histidine kinase